MSPRVSIGLPVFNGSRYLEEAIESVVAQTFGDFELVISDNGSTDETPAIARRWAERDHRIRHLRHEETRGARWNFNTVFAACEGELFVWLAHDDLWVPDFLERCVAELDADTNAVLAFSHVAEVDDRCEVVGSRAMHMRVGSERVHERLWDVLMVWHDCLPVFGLIRADTLRTTSLIGPYASGDHLLLAELCVVGKFAIVDDHLFKSRIHPGQSIQRYDIWEDHHAYTVWMEGADAPPVAIPQWRLLADLVRAVMRAPIGVLERIRCAPALVRWAVRYRSLLAKDLRIAWRTRGKSRDEVSGRDRQ